jgi:DNA-binding response OmpR family regulator
VAKLRVKLESAIPERRLIDTHFGFGYRFDPKPRPALLPVA